LMHDFRNGERNMTNKDALVSIIVPVYGTEAYLPACIESICNQSYKNLQIILVDDQSPDRCPEICDGYAKKDPRILVIHQKNKGVSGARNTGITHAFGDFLMFVDSDDELYTNAVEILVQDARDYCADVVSAIKRVVDKNGNTTCIDADGNCNVFHGENTLLLALEGDPNTNSACAKLFRASFLQDIQFDEGKNLNEDGFFMFQCFLKKPLLVQHNVAVYQYNTRQHSSSRQSFSENYLSMLYFCDRKKELIAAQYPQYMHLCYNMEVRTNLYFLDVLCKTTEKKYRAIQKQSVDTVRRLYKYHVPINKHHKMLAWIASHGLYPLYKWAVRLKYYR
jgi:glycosyltransferase involved in cell wall biosynthesis